MKETTLAWQFETTTPLSLRKVNKMIGKKWYLRESDYRADSISGPITDAARVCIFELGSTEFIVHLLVEAKNDSDLNTLVVEAKDKLFKEVLSRLNTREIIETEVEAPNDIMTGYYYE